MNIQINHLSRVAFHIFSMSVYWYGVLITLAFAVGLILAQREAKRVGQNPEIYSDFVILILIFGIIGARLYYVVFEWDSFKNDLLKIFNIREGGLAIYGGIIMVFLVGIIFAKRKKLDFGALADVCAPSVVMGQAIGRWGNFFNREVFGSYTESLFAMRYMTDQVAVIPESVARHIIEVNGVSYIQVQPTFLYECLWNIGVFIFLTIFKKHKKFNGQVFLMYLIGYGAGRFWIEGIRTDQLMLFQTGIPISQLLSAVLVVGSIIIMIYCMSKTKNAVKGE